jgi:hypothetical protein
MSSGPNVELLQFSPLLLAARKRGRGSGEFMIEITLAVASGRPITREVI